MSLILEIEVDNKGVVKGIKNTSGHIKKLDKNTKKTSKSIVKSFDLMKGAIYGAGVVAVSSAILKMANLASAADETKNKFDVVFRGVTNAGNAISELSDKTGYAESSLNKYTSSLGDLIKPAGFAADEAFNLSKNITKLSLDLASFNNLRPEDVVRDFQSALAGSSEALQKYGIDARETTLAQKAFNMGLIDNARAYQKLAPEQRRQVRTQALIAKSFDDSKDAIGDLNRTQDTYANQTRVLSEKTKELSENLGKFLVPVLSDIAKYSNNALDAFNDFLDLNTENDFTKITEGQNQSLETIYTWLLAGNTQREIAKKLGQDELEYLQADTGIREFTLENIKAQINENNRLLEIEKTRVSELERITEIEKQAAERKKAAAERLKAEIAAILADEKEIAKYDKAILDIHFATVEEIITEGAVLENQVVPAAQHFAVELDKAWKVGMNLYKTVATDLASGLGNAVAYGEKLDDVFESILKNVAKAVTEMLVLQGAQMLFSGIFGIPLSLGGLFGFQHGGSFKVGGSGGTDSQLVAFKASPNETVTVTPPGKTVNNNSNINISISANRVDERFVRFELMPLINKLQSEYN